MFFYLKWFRRPTKCSNFSLRPSQRKKWYSGDSRISWSATYHNYKKKTFFSRLPLGWERGKTNGTSVFISSMAMIFYFLICPKRFTRKKLRYFYDKKLVIFDPWIQMFLCKMQYKCKEFTHRSLYFYCILHRKFVFMGQIWLIFYHQTNVSFF